ncbi:MAG: hypothetical protein Q9173_002610 [Seirophora scorigena]
MTLPQPARQPLSSPLPTSNQQQQVPESHNALLLLILRPLQLPQLGLQLQPIHLIVRESKIRHPITAER